MCFPPPPVVSCQTSTTTSFTIIKLFKKMKPGIILYRELSTVLVYVKVHQRIEKRYFSNPQKGKLLSCQKKPSTVKNEHFTNSAKMHYPSKTTSTQITFVHIKCLFGKMVLLYINKMVLLYINSLVYIDTCYNSQIIYYN